MKRVLLIILGLYLFTSGDNAQVIFDFETDTQGFIDIGWGPAIDGIQKTTQDGNGVLQVTFNGSKGTEGVFGPGSGLVDKTDAKVISFYIKLPTGTPDNLHIQLFAQDNAHWSHKSVTYMAKDIPKEVWYPVNFYLEKVQITDAATFDVKNNKFGWLGMSIGTWDSDPAVLAWNGSILVDNVTLLGVQPIAINDFEAGIAPFAPETWGGTAQTGFVQVADPTSSNRGSVGELSMNFGANADKGGIKFDMADLKSSNIMQYYVYLPADIPDGVQIGVVVQDRTNWTWTELQTDVKDIPKQTWYPLTFDFVAENLKNPNLVITGNVVTGLQVQNYSQSPVVPWSGKILVDDVQLLSKEVGAKWVMADFNTPAAGVQDFSTAWGQIVLSRAVVDNNGVLQCATDFTKGTPGILRDEVKLSFKTEEEVDTVIDGFSMDIFIPNDFPDGIRADIVVQPKTGGWPWLNKMFNIGTDIKKGEWGTLTWMLADFRSQIEDINASNKFFIEFKNVEGITWSGNILFDNFTVLGRPAPIPDALTAPLVTSRVDTADLPGSYYEAVVLEWIDNKTKTGTETYNIYRSETPINDLSAAGVVQIATKVPHGLQTWAHRVWSKEVEQKTFYFAVTASDGLTETALNNQCKTGPVPLKTYAAAKVKYDKDFASSFVADGDGSEFAKYADYTIKPESGWGPQAWTVDNLDMNWTVNIVVDDKYMYLYIDVVDDDLNDDPNQQVWSGDGFDFFAGFYDASKLNTLHPKGVQNLLGDWRISFTNIGGIALNGGAPTAVIPVPGVTSNDFTVLQKFTADGYFIEARFDMDSLAQNNSLDIFNGMLMPLKLDGNDWDPKLGDTGRSGMTQWGVTGGTVDEDWMRPSCWGFMQVIDGPVGVKDNANLLPKEFKLYNNYPNPFNPATTIKYDLPKEAKVLLKVYDITGREVATLVDETQSAGYKQVNFNAANLSSGIYFYRISAGNFMKSEKMTLLK